MNVIRGGVWFALGCLLVHLTLQSALAENTPCAQYGICPDQQDPPLSECPGDLPGEEGSDSAVCTSCTPTRPQYRGMAQWWISQPYLNLRLEDTPLWHTPARGEPVRFQVSYRQRGGVLEYPDVFGVGTNWSCSFRAYLLDTSGSPLKLHRGRGRGDRLHARPAPVPGPVHPQQRGHRLPAATRRRHGRGVRQKLCGRDQPVCLFTF